MSVNVDNSVYSSFRNWRLPGQCKVGKSNDKVLNTIDNLPEDRYFIQQVNDCEELVLKDGIQDIKEPITIFRNVKLMI